LGQFEEAIEAYDMAIGIDNNYKFAYNGKGLALDSLGYF
jgi:tetratricopeptide (TPR) repeat protein